MALANSSVSVHTGAKHQLSRRRRSQLCTAAGFRAPEGTMGETGRLAVSSSACKLRQGLSTSFLVGHFDVTVFKSIREKA